MADNLPWVDEAAAKDAIAAVRKDSDPADWYEPTILIVPLIPSIFHCQLLVLAVTQ